MYAPGGFNADIEAWSTLGIYGKIKLLDHLPKNFSCIMFDRRECGQSGGRVEPITWTHFVAQGKGLLDHLQHSRAHLMGGCMGCAPVAAFAAAIHDMVASMVLLWPVGGDKYRLSSHRRFAEHLAFVRGEGLTAVVDAGAARGQAVRRRSARRALGVGNQARSGFRRVLRHVRSRIAIFALRTMRDALFDRDTAPGAPPEELVHTEIPALILPGHDDSHATSAARYLDECLPLSEYWDMPVERQSEDATNARVLEFLAKVAV